MTQRSEWLIVGMIVLVFGYMWLKPDVVKAGRVETKGKKERKLDQCD